MDLDIIKSTKEGEITQFLCDVRDYFKASLATSEYENTSNIFHLTASETTEKLLNRCEGLLNRLKHKNGKFTTNATINEVSALLPSPKIQIKNHQRHNIRDDNISNVKNSIVKDTQGNNNEIDIEDASYLDMTASNLNDRKQSSAGRVINLKNSEDSAETFRCSTFVVQQNKSFLHRLHDSTNDVCKEVNEHHEDMFSSSEDTQIYDICQVTTQGSEGEDDEEEETEKAITQDSHFSHENIDCPYMDLPAGHLSIKKSIKYGQLLKIEKRLFFDQSKKCYCGILNDWLLCYADGPTSNRPTIILYLKIPGIEIEHFGEGKRREISFQITTCDPNKKFLFQAINEIDAKEWIHAIEAAISCNTTSENLRNSSTRKLPTPPVMEKIKFLNSFQTGAKLMNKTTSNDCIYEEPSPIHQIIIKSSSEKPPELPVKQNNFLELPHKFDYDIPKCPPQPFKDTAENDVLLMNPYENSNKNSPEKALAITLSNSLYLVSSPISAQKLNLKLEENLDFQAKVKDVHSKLTSQLASGPNIKKSLKNTLSAISHNDTVSLALSLPPSSSSETSNWKKQKKTTNPSNSPQKMTHARNWFLNRLNKTTSSTRSNISSDSSPSKCKQSENENLLNSSSDAYNGNDIHSSNLSNNSISPVLKNSTPSSGKSKVNMIINQLEASGHLASIFNLDVVASFSSFCDNDSNNYEPIMAVSVLPENLIKKHT